MMIGAHSPTPRPLLTNANGPGRPSPPPRWGTRPPSPEGYDWSSTPDHAVVHDLLDLVSVEREHRGWASWTLISLADATIVQAATHTEAIHALRQLFDLSEEAKQTRPRRIGAAPTFSGRWV
jgi:hypothetical protein